MADTPKQLKEWFNEERYTLFADQLGSLCAGFERARFLGLVLEGLQGRELMQRLRQTTLAFQASVPGAYRDQIAVLRRLAPLIKHSFVGVLPCDFVGQYGIHDFDFSMEALAAFTACGSGEFAIREYLRSDFERAMRFTSQWVKDSNEHVRRLASEGTRPRLPWSFRLEAVVKEPRLTRGLMQALRRDESLYVRKSVANHLNDVAKDHPEYLLEQLESWDFRDERSAWIARRACRTLIKDGERRALALFGVEAPPQLCALSFATSVEHLRIGESLELRAEFVGAATHSQRLVIDFAVHYVRDQGRSNRKVFKWKELSVEKGERVRLSKKLAFVLRSTRRLYPGAHRVELLINGQCLAEASFALAD